MESKFKVSITTVFVPLFAALISVSGFIAVPLPGTPVPIVLQNMMPILAAGLLGGLHGTAATAIFLFAGIIGLPVFSGGRGGIAHLLGPTGGFLAGYLAAAAILILFFKKPSQKDLHKNSSSKKAFLIKTVAASFLGFSVIYILGIPRFMYVTKRSFQEAFVLACLPYLLGDFIKMILTSFLIYKLRPVSAKYISANSN